MRAQTGRRLRDASWLLRCLVCDPRGLTSRWRTPRVDNSLHYGRCAELRQANKSREGAPALGSGVAPGEGLAGPPEQSGDRVDVERAPVGAVVEGSRSSVWQQHQRGVVGTEQASARIAGIAAKEGEV